MNKVFEETKALLKGHEQGHLLAFWGQLGPVQRRNLLAQIEELDLSKIDDWVANYVKRPAISSIRADFRPVRPYGPEPADAGQAQKYSKARQLGRELVAAGKVAAFVVAGGQGTRLGFEGPKGDFPISPVKNKTLFRIFAETIAAVSKKYRTVCPWYVMTNPLNYDQTRRIFCSNDYYGLDEKNIFIFQQGELPNFSFDGKIMLADKDRISRSPDGHGGSLKALFQSGAVADMKRRGVKFISYFQVDNPLVNIFDPLFIGLHRLEDAQMSSKALVKTGPKEKVGVFCLLDGRVAVIEYSDLSDELLSKRDRKGALVFGLGNIAIHIISVDFVEELNREGFSLPLHRAVKRIACLDETGELVSSGEPNGIKLESFVFDALPLADKSMILQTVRSEEFAPVKNAGGTDSAETAKQMMTARAADWLESAGVAVPSRPDGSVDAAIEIAPGFAIEKDDIKEKLDRIPKIKPGDEIYLS